jgi:hypothetical protein
MQSSLKAFLWSFEAMNIEHEIIQDAAGYGDTQEVSAFRTLENCIQVIWNLPDYYLHYRVGLTSEWGGKTPQQEFLEFNRRVYRAVGLWLEYYLLDRTEHNAELILTDKVHYKPLAERAVAFYRLAQEVWLRSELQVQIPTPGFWMIACERDLLEIGLNNSGYTGNPKVQGKTVLYSTFVARSERWIDPSNFSHQEGSVSLTALQALQSEGVRIAAGDTQFEEAYWRPFWKNMRRVQRQIRQSQLSVVYLDQSGELEIVRRGKQSKASKGFGSDCKRP